MLRLERALERYDDWVRQLENASAQSADELMAHLVDLLNDYKNFIDVELIFDSDEDFLYRQRGQLKLDNSVLEEFLPIMVRKCLPHRHLQDYQIGSQAAIFSSAYFASSLESPGLGGGMMIKTKNHDFSMSRRIYLRTSFDENFAPSRTRSLETSLGYVLAELKTNLDKTMFQEASASAHEAKLAVPGAKYYLLCDYLDMQPISTAITDIDEILILRKAKRIHASARQAFNSSAGRRARRDWYVGFLQEHPYATDVFRRFLSHVTLLMSDGGLEEESILKTGYF